MSTTYNEKAVLEVETTGSLIEAATGIAVIVLAIIGLARGDTGFMTSITGIVLGAALLAEGGTVAAEYSKLLAMVTGGTLGAVELGGGMTVEILAGGSAIVLGILRLLGFSPEILLPVAVIAVGTSSIFAASGLQRLNTLKLQAAGLSDIAQKVAQAIVAGAIAAQVLAGGGAIVLGILALTLTAHAAVLTLVGLLVLGASVTVSGAALTGRLLRLFNIKQA
jgi:hypothetical protein